jgi:hypothetical protein
MADLVGLVDVEYRYPTVDEIVITHKQETLTPEYVRSKKAREEVCFLRLASELATGCPSGTVALAKHYVELKR